MSDRMNNIMSDLEEIIKIGVHIIYEELVKILRVVMRFLNDIDVSSPMGLHKKRVGVEVEMVMIKEDDINFERNRYGFPKDIYHPIGITSDLKGEDSRTEFFNE
mgnify:CR=1 FL=1